VIISKKKEDIVDGNEKPNLFAKFPTNISSIGNNKNIKNNKNNNSNTNTRDSTAVIVMFFEDITHEAYLQRLEELNLYKMKMLSSISHELKTPLNCSMGMLEELSAFV